MPSPNIAVGEVVEGALEVGHREALVDRQPLDLVEDGRVRRVELVGAVGPPGADDVDREVAGQHAAGLDRRGVGAQHDAGVLGLEEERVLHRCGPGGPAEVERVEVEPLGLDLGALGDLPAHRHEDVVDPLHQGGQRVPGAPRGRGRRAA